MKRVLKVEFFRFIPMWIVLMVLYLIFVTISYTKPLLEQNMAENGAIDLIVLIVILSMSIMMLLDRIRPRKEFYFFSSISDTNLRIGRLLTILLFAVMTAGIAIIRYHLKLILTEDPYFYGGPVILIFVRLDNMFFGKTFLECLHPLNWIFSLLFLSWVLFRSQDLLFLLRKKYLQSAWWQAGTSILIGFGLWAGTLFIMHRLNDWLSIIDLNHWNERVQYFSISDLELNFLFIGSAPLLILLILGMHRLLDYGPRNKANRWG